MQGNNLGNGGIPVTVGAKSASVINAFNGSTLQGQLPVDAPLGATTLKVGAAAPFNITLVQYCPALAADGQPDNLAAAVHYPSGTPVSPSFPASPNEQIGLVATGLGPTNPVFPTGTSPNDNSAVPTTLPTVSVAGKPATVVASFLQPGGPGFYIVVFTMTAGVTNGNQSVAVSTSGLTSNAANVPVATGPVIASVTNAASYNDPARPNGPIAQGSIL